MVKLKVPINLDEIGIRKEMSVSVVGRCLHDS